MRERSAYPAPRGDRLRTSRDRGLAERTLNARPQLNPWYVGRTEVNDAMDGMLKVVGSFELKARSLFVVFGSLTEGELRPGMKIALALGDISITGSIATGEVVDFVAHGESFPAITLHCDDPDDLEIWRSAIAEGVVIEASSDDAA